ncbi:MAG TPA: glycosyltransferase [Candidatus Polarisedimenticolia bacterium]|nr:glycosyltransferase [Candidatus Polarisedimenticolia bacterium]
MRSISVLICTRDRSAMLEECLRSVLACAPGATEIVVVDQSADETTRLAVCRQQGGKVPVRYLRSRGKGLSHAKNQGIADCTSDIVAFTDDDCRVDAGWLGAITGPIAAGTAGAVAGRTLPEPGSDGGEETRSMYAPPQARSFSARTHPWRVGGGGNFAVLREAMRRVGPFDERFGPGAPLESAEDMDMVHRLLRAGFRIVYVPEAVVQHRSWRAPVENRRLARRYGVGAGGYFAKHFVAGDLISGWRFVQRAGVRSLSLASGALRGDGRKMEEQLEYLKGLFQGGARYFACISAGMAGLEKGRAR